MGHVPIKDLVQEARDLGRECLAVALQPADGIVRPALDASAVAARCEALAEHIESLLNPDG